MQALEERERTGKKNVLLLRKFHWSDDKLLFKICTIWNAYMASHELETIHGFKNIKTVCLLDWFEKRSRFSFPPLRKSKDRVLQIMTFSVKFWQKCSVWTFRSFDRVLILFIIIQMSYERFCLYGCINWKDLQDFLLFHAEGKNLFFVYWFLGPRALNVSNYHIKTQSREITAS